MTKQQPAAGVERKKRGPKAAKAIIRDNGKRKRCSNAVDVGVDDAASDDKKEAVIEEGVSGSAGDDNGKATTIDARAVLTDKEKRKFKQLVRFGKLHSLTVVELTGFLGRLGLPVSGSKESLLKRLTDVLLGAKIIPTAKQTVFPLPTFRCHIF